jgi:hypothetical protein
MEPLRKEPPIPFAPVHVSSRHDGWTAERQIAFIEALAETACVEHACRAVGMSDSAAYRLRRSTRGALFREAWDAALDYALHRLEQAALARALHGVPRPVFHKGEQVGEWRDYDERLTMFLLKNRRPARFGKWMDKLLPPILPMQDDADGGLDDKLEQIDNNADDFEDDTPDSRTRVEE